MVGAVTVLVMPAQAAVGTNKTLNFQGRLLTATGAVIPDGNYNMQFKIYQDGTGTSAGNPGGSLEWTEEWLGANSQAVTLKNGYFSVNLGSITAFGSSVDWNQDTLWLSMNVAGGGNATSTGCSPFSSCTPDGEMLPMRRLTSSVYALNSAQLGGLTSSQFVQLATGIQSDSSTSQPSIGINKTAGSQNIMTLQAGGVDAFTVSSTGATTVRTTTNSTGATQVQNAAGTLRPC